MPHMGDGYPVNIGLVGVEQSEGARNGSEPENVSVASLEVWSAS
jgi:hypothetical protein